MKLWHVYTCDHRLEDGSGGALFHRWFSSRKKALDWAIEMTRQYVHAIVLDLPDWAMDSVKEDAAKPVLWVLEHVVITKRGMDLALSVLNRRGFIDHDLLNVTVEITKDGGVKTIAIDDITKAGLKGVST